MLNYVKFMKPDIHPKYHEKSSVACACGNTFEVGSTLERISVEICSNCHPFYTGKQKLIDSAKRVDKFQARAQKTSSVAPTRKGRKIKTVARKARKAAKQAGA